MGDRLGIPRALSILLFFGNIFWWWKSNLRPRFPPKCKNLGKKITAKKWPKCKKIHFFRFFLVFIGGKWGQERVGMKSILTCQTIEIGLKNGMSKDLYLSERGQVDAAKTFSAKRNFFLAANFLAKFSHFWGFSRAQISNLKSEKTFIENFFDFWPKNRNFRPKIELFWSKTEDFDQK